MGVRVWAVAAAIAALLAGDVIGLATHRSSASGPDASSIPAHVDHQRWKVAAPDGTPDEVLVTGGVALVSAQTGSWVDALDLSTGRVRWTHRVGGSLGSYVVSGPNVWTYGFDAGSSDVGLTAYDAETGAALTTVHVDEIADEAADGSGGLVVADRPGVQDVSRDGVVRTLAPGDSGDSGSLVVDTATSTYAAILGSEVAVGSVQGGTPSRIPIPGSPDSADLSGPLDHRAVVETGAAAYVLDLGSATLGPALPTSGIVGFAQATLTASTLVTLQRSGSTGYDLGGRKLWTRADLAPLRPFVVGDLLLEPGSDGLVAVDARTGRTIWSDAHCGFVTSGDGTSVLVPCEVSGHIDLVDIDVRTGTPRWHLTGALPMETSLDPVAYGPGTVVVIGPDGHVHAYD